MRILIVGGYGAFGARVAERLAREAALEIIIAGRSNEKAAAYAQELARTAKARLTHAELNATTATADAIRALGARVVINASGPFQSQDYGLARACIDAGCHYVDLADARHFVTGITTLDAHAKAAGVAVICRRKLRSGAVVGGRAEFCRRVRSTRHRRDRHLARQQLRSWSGDRGLDSVAGGQAAL